LIDYRDQIAMMKSYHLISIFLAIYLQNIGDETFALSFPDRFPKICQAHNQIPCYSNWQCNDHNDQTPYGLCKNVRNTHATGKKHK
jgi:hypothetical protein